MITISNMKTREIARKVKKIVSQSSAGTMISSTPIKNDSGWSVQVGHEPLKTPLIIQQRAKEIRYQMGL